jgi:phage tail sheath protein FI
MPDLKAPGVYTQQARSSAVPVVAAASDICGIVAQMQKGPPNRPIKIDGLAEMLAIFGTYVSGVYGAHAVRQYFEQGGREIYISRLVGASGTVKASRQLQNSTPTNSLLAEAFSVGDHGNALSVKHERIDTVIASVAVDVAAAPTTSMVLSDVRRVYVGATLKVVDVTPDTTRFVVTRVDRTTKQVFFASYTPAAITAAGSTVTLEEMRITVYRDGTAVQMFPTQGAMAYSALAADKYFRTVINTNDPTREITVTDNAIVASPTVDPRPVTDSAPVALTLGADGAAIGDADVVGSGSTGLYAYDAIQDCSVIAAPGYATTTVHQGLISYCEARVGNPMFAVLDIPTNLTAAQAVTHVETTARLYSEHAAIYAPWVKQTAPDTGVITAFPPSGFVLGVYARTTRTRGVQKAPAGVNDGKLNGVVDLERHFTETELGTLNLSNINAIRAFADASAISVFGARTLARGDFQYINVKRVFNFFIASMKPALLASVFEQNDETTRAAISRSMSTFCLLQWRKKVLKGDSADLAFVVTCNETNNPASVQQAGQLSVDVSLAVANPAEFIVLTLSRDLRELQAELAAAGV